MTYTLTADTTTDAMAMEVRPETIHGRGSDRGPLNPYQQRMIRNARLSQFVYRQNYLITPVPLAPMKFHGQVLRLHTPAQLSYMFGAEWTNIREWLRDHHDYSVGDVVITPRTLNQFEQNDDDLRVSFQSTHRARPSTGALGNFIYAMSTARSHVDADSVITPEDVMRHQSMGETRAIGLDLFESMRYMGINIDTADANALSSAAGYAVMALAFTSLQNLMMEQAEDHRVTRRAEERYVTERTRRREVESRLASVEAGSAQRQRVMDTAAQFTRAETPQEKLEAFRSMMLLVDEASAEVETATTS